MLLIIIVLASLDRSSKQEYYNTFKLSVIGKFVFAAFGIEMNDDQILQ